jgi:hypothetical protein
MVCMVVCFACDSDNPNEQKDTLVNIRFQYTNNLAGTDKFATEVDKVNLYVFDAKGCFINEYCVPAHELQGGNTITLNMEPGIYDFVVWGNLADAYLLCSLEKGITNIEDCHVLLKCNENDVVDVQPTSLFFGSVSKVNVKPANSQETIALDMIKNTKSIRVITTNLDMDNIEKSFYRCSITSLGKGCKFNNTAFYDQKIEYLPMIRINDKNEFVADFVVLHLSKNDSDNLHLVFTRNDSKGQVSELFNKSLTELLLPLSLHVDFQLQDSLEIDLDFGDIY